MALLQFYTTYSSYMYIYATIYIYTCYFNYILLLALIIYIYTHYIDVTYYL